MSLRIQYRRSNAAHSGGLTLKMADDRCLAACGILRAMGRQAVPYQGSVYTTATREEWTEATIEHAWLRVGAVVHQEES